MRRQYFDATYLHKAAIIVVAALPSLLDANKEIILTVSVVARKKDVKVDQTPNCSNPRLFNNRGVVTMIVPAFTAFISTLEIEVVIARRSLRPCHRLSKLLINP